MQLSQRVQRIKPSSTLAISARVKALRAAGEDVIGFGAGEPDAATPEPIVAAAIEALRAGRTHYEPVAGPADARTAIARKLREENGIDCDAADVVISTGAKQSLNLALQSLVDPERGDQVIILTPAWVSYRPMVELAGGTVVEVAALIENDFKVTPEQLESAITDRTRVVMLNSPSNPCGTMYTPDELRAIGAVIAAHPGVIIVADEIYEKLIYTADEHFSIGSMPELADRVVTINGLSKAFAMTGWRIGYLAAPGAGGVVAKAATRLQSQMTSNITSFCYPAIEVALTQCADAVESMRRTFAMRADLIAQLVGRWPDVACPTPTGAFYVFPDMSHYIGRTTPRGRSITSATDLAEALLDEAKVAVVPGEDFGACALNHMRLSFACSEEMIREGCTRIEAWLQSLRPAGVTA